MADERRPKGALSPVQAAKRQKAYRRHRRLWAQALGRPYIEDGGVQAGRGTVNHVTMEPKT